MRNTYIDNKDIDLAKKEYYNRLNIESKFEEIDVLESLDRISFELVEANVSSPNYNAAAMDGIAVKSDITLDANDKNLITLKEGEDFSYINTGNIVKSPYDSVIMIEDVIELEKGKVQILKPSYPWQHIRQIGEDIIASEMIIPSKHKIRPIDIGALLSGGIKKIKVYKKPKIGILPTGTEIVESVDDLREGSIIDSNSRVFEAAIKKDGGISNRYSPIKDDYNLLKERILKVIDENDMLLILAGSSAGSKDYTVSLIRELGEVIVHGVAIKPGKPVILGIIQDKPVIGVPGYPVSSYLVYDNFIKQLIGKYIAQEQSKEIVKGNISRRIHSSLKNMEFIRVNLGYVNKQLIATPLSSGAGVTMSLVKADGIAIIPRSSEGVEVGDKVEVELLKPLREIKKTLVSIGSHDLIMDILSDMIPLSSGHVGSMAGILSMKRGESHIAPIHLLDEDTGEYNISYIKKYFSNKKMVLVKGVKRKQGFIVEKENPKNIRGFKDLNREDIVFANRQRGAGTRVLLDYHLKLDKINKDNIKGYKRELNTHMAVSMAVKTKSADVGLGIYSAAKAMDLDFIPVSFEDYDFLIPYDILDTEEIKRFINTLKSKEFKKRVEKLGGYNFQNTGDIVIID